jgi:hypothetical protein
MLVLVHLHFPMPMQVPVSMPEQVQVQVQVQVVVENRASKYPCRHCRIQSLSLLSWYYTICLPLYAFAFARMDNRGFCCFCNKNRTHRSRSSSYPEGRHMRNKNWNSQTFLLRRKYVLYKLP